MPEVLTVVASEVRHQMAIAYGAKLKRQEELQGELLQKISQDLEDPDVEVVRGVREGSTPMGILKPIVPCGVFPLAISGEADTWAQDCNYLSYEEHKAGAEALLRKEIDAGWLEQFETENALEKKHGSVHYSRIGSLPKSRTAGETATDPRLQEVGYQQKGNYERMEHITTDFRFH